MQIEKKVLVSIEGEELVRLLIEALRPKARASEGRDRVFFRALSNLVGLTAVEAVKVANKYANEHSLPRIATDEFRKWLPEILSQTFREVAK